MASSSESLAAAKYTAASRPACAQTGTRRTDAIGSCTLCLPITIQFCGKSYALSIPAPHATGRLDRRLGSAWRRDVGPETIAPNIDKLIRSEEHTSELQSQSNLVCRLLLEKKKNTL